MILSIQTLGNNLEEINAAANTRNHKENGRVPNFSGTKIYASSSGYGRLWRWFFDYYGIFFGDKLERSKLERAMDLTRCSFQYHLKAIQKNSRRYCDYLASLSQEIPVDENAMHKHRKSVIAWNTSVYPIYKNILALNNGTLVETDILPSNIDENAIIDIRRCQMLIELEGVLGEPLPIHALYAASSDEELTVAQEKELIRFAKKINRNQSKFTIGSFHRTMSDLIALFQKGDPEVKPDLANLELTLSKYGWDLYKQTDEDHIKWRNSRVPGQTLYCNGREIILGELMPSVDHGEDFNLVFAVKNDDKVVVSIGINEALHALKRRIAVDSEWGIRSAAYVDVCPTFALIERLHDPINSLQWKSPPVICSENEHFDRNDQAVANPIALLLRWFVNESRTPTNFNKNHLMFNQAGQLKCLKIGLEGEFDFNALEDFVLECTNGNAQVFMQLMEFSTLDKHPCAKFYKQMLIHALNNVTQDAGDVAACEGVDDYRVVDRGRELYKNVKILENKCMHHLRRFYHTEKIEDLSYTLRTALLHFYEMSSAGGLLPSCLEELILNDIITVEKLEKKPVIRVIGKKSRR